MRRHGRGRWPEVQIQDVIESRSIPVPECGCILWLGNVNEQGYGRISSRGNWFLAHRIAFEIATGAEVPSGLGVCHKCDTPLCINPAHMFVGTQRENMLDATRKGRMASGDRAGSRTHRHKWMRGGEACHSAKLTQHDVDLIIASSLPHRTLAAQFNVTHSCIYHIKRKARRG